MTSRLKLAVAGAGLIGKRHVAALRPVAAVELAAIVDPTDAAREFAAANGAPWFASLDDLFSTARPDGIILATPNNLHIEQGHACVAAACPMLIEKPIATRASDATALVDAAKAAGVALLVGHHRRHNPLMQRARAIIDEGQLGEIRAVHIHTWFYKPDDYFDIAPWRKQTGAGPISVNLIHDIDLARYLCGEIDSVQALVAPSARGYQNEDVAVAMLRFAGGALGSLTLSDTIVAPWSWELTAGENPAYPQTRESCYLIGGSEASMSLPGLELWRHAEPKSWMKPITATYLGVEASDPLVNQIEHFAAVIRGEAEPLVSGAEGTRSLAVVEAIARAAATGAPVELG